MRRGKDADWNIYNEHGNTDWAKVPIAVLMDIRDELKALNRVFACSDAQAIPGELRAIRRHTARIPVVKATPKRRVKK